MSSNNLRKIISPFHGLAESCILICRELPLVVLNETHLSCSSLLPRNAIVALRELLDTGVDFGWLAVAMNSEAEVCRNGSKTNYWAQGDVTLQWHSSRCKCGIKFYNSVATFSCIFQSTYICKILSMFTQNHVTYVLYEILVRLTKKFIYDINIYITSDYCKTLYKLKNIQRPFQFRSSSY